MRRQLEQNYAAIRVARAKGIRILAGTDSGNAAAFEHGRHHGREAELLVREIGMRPMEAIVAFTLISSAGPLRQSLRVDPLIALREE